MSEASLEVQYIKHVRTRPMVPHLLTDPSVLLIASGHPVIISEACSVINTSSILALD
jgi:hypothetical protein